MNVNITSDEFLTYHVIHRPKQILLFNKQSFKYKIFTWFYKTKIRNTDLNFHKIS